jgi:large subunit ribosomal protein L23
MEDIIIRPLISEKASANVEDRNRYAFVVKKTANKIQIKKAVELVYGVSVASVRTCIMPAKRVVRHTKAGVLAGRNSSYKKAIIDLQSGETIDIYGNI